MKTGMIKQVQISEEEISITRHKDCVKSDLNCDSAAHVLFGLDLKRSALDDVLMITTFKGYEQECIKLVAVIVNQNVKVLTQESSNMVLLDLVRKSAESKDIESLQEFIHNISLPYGEFLFIYFSTKGYKNVKEKSESKTLDISEQRGTNRVSIAPLHTPEAKRPKNERAGSQQIGHQWSWNPTTR